MLVSGKVSSMLKNNWYNYIIDEDFLFLSLKISLLFSTNKEMNQLSCFSNVLTVLHHGKNANVDFLPALRDIYVVV